MERWYRRNRFGGVYGDPIGMHAFNHWPAMYGKAHPDYFAMQPDGTRRNYEHAGGGHLCMTNPDVVREVVREKLKLFRENPFSRYSPVMPGDSLGLYYCRCERCRQELRPELGEKQSHSDAVWRFVSKVAGKVYEKAPDKFITCCAYANYSSPPSFPLLPNIAVTLCCDSPPSASLDYKNSFLAYLNAWKRTGAQLYAWDYWDTARRHRGTRGAPSFFARQLQETYLMSAGIVKGRAIELCEISADGKNQNGWANWMYDIQNLYVASRLLWDPSCNVDAVLENYCKDLYGPAADTIREFYDAMEERWLQHPANWNYETCWYQTYSPEFVDRMMALLRKAVLQTRGAEPYHARAQKTLKGFLPFEKASFLYRKPKRKQNPPVIRVPDTADWNRAAKIGNFCDSYNIRDITAKTKVFLRHDRKNLYLRFQSEFPPERKQILRADQCGERDALLWNYEGVEVFLAGEGETYYQFILSPDGKLADFRYPDGKLQWNSSGIRFSARHDGSNIWTGELSIPLSELKFDRTAPDGALKVNFYRNHYYREENGQWHWEQSCWLPVYGSFHDRNCFGKLYLEK